MPNLKPRKPKPPLADPKDPNALGSWAHKHLDWLLSRNYSAATVFDRERWLRHFVEWCDTRSLRRPDEITRPIIERYQRHWYLHRKANGKPLSFRTQTTRMVPIQTFFRWLTRQNVIGSNPASDLDLPKTTVPIPKHVLTPSEAELVLGQPDVKEPLGLRDRAILEVLWSTGVRRRELAGLAMYDLDEERGTLRVRCGKGGKERTVPIGERAIAWVNRYLEEVRPRFAVSIHEQTLFLTSEGYSMDLGALSKVVTKYIDAAKTGKRGSCHLWRHSMATAMLEGGADVRFIQEMLGHAKLNTTVIYTHVAIRALKEVHTRCHPAALLRPAKPETGTNVKDGTRAATAAEELLQALADDDDGEDDEHGRA